MDRETYTDSRVVDLAAKMIAVKMNIDSKAGNALAKRYQVESIPTIVFTNASGKKLIQFVGFKPPDDFIKEAQTAMRKVKK